MEKLTLECYRGFMQSPKVAAKELGGLFNATLIMNLGRPI